MSALATLSGMDRATGQTLVGADHVRQSITDLLTTPVGSRLCARDYGSRLPDLVDAPLNDEGRQAIYAETAGAVARFLPQIVLTRIEFGDPAPGALSLALHVRERGTPAGAATIVPIAIHTKG